MNKKIRKNVMKILVNFIESSQKFFKNVGNRKNPVNVCESLKIIKKKICEKLNFPKKARKRW